MTAKEYLRQITILDAKIRRRQRQVEELKTAATHITTMFDENKVQTGHNGGDKIADIVAEWVVKEEELVYLMDELIRLKDKIITEIHQLEDVRYIQILEMRYVDQCTFEQIAVNMNYDIRWIYRLHGFALQEFTRKKMTSESHV